MRIRFPIASASPQSKPLAIFVLAALSVTGPAAANSITDLGVIAPGISSYGYGNLDGSVAVGQVHVMGGGDFGFYWTPAGGMQAIQLPATPPSIGGVTATDLYVNNISADGKFAVGSLEAPMGTFNTLAYRWSLAGGVETLGYLPGGSFSTAMATNADGSVVVGQADDGQNHSRAFRWLASSGMQSLGTLTGYDHSGASGVNGSGDIVVGSVWNNNTDHLAYRWTASGGMQSMGVPLGWTQSSAAAVSTDGDVVAGQVNNAQGNAGQAFRWTTKEGYQVLGTLNGGSSSYAVAVSGNGAVVVGGSKDGSVTASQADPGDRAFRWSKTSNMQTVEAWAKVSLPSPAVYAYGTNYDGSVVVGTLMNGHAFIATGQGVVALDGIQTNSLASTAQAPAASMNLSSLVFTGAHGNPLLNRPAPGKKSCFWTLGDLGENSGHADDSSMGLAEIGGCHALTADTQIDLALGKAWSKQTGDLSSRSELKSIYGTVGLLSHFDGALWGLAEVLYQSGTADIERGYLNGGVPTVAAGHTSVVTSGIRLRVIGEDLIKLSALDVSPYLELSKLRTRTGGYTETDPAFPATFNASTEIATTLRLGAHGILPLTDKTRLLAQVEADHRFEESGPFVSGNVIGAFDFNLGGNAVQRNWERFSLGIEHKVGDGTVNLVFNHTTQDSGANNWLTVSYRASF